MTDNPVSFDKRGPVGWICINNPPVNVLDQATRAAILAVLGKLSVDSAIRAVVLTASGRTFSAGMDMTEFGHAPRLPTLQDVITALERINAISVAAIRGSIFGGGLELAMTCHWRVAGSAAKLVLPEASLGIIPGAGGTQRAPRLMGVEAALRFITSAKPLDAAAALETGLVDAVFDDDSGFETAVAEYVAALLLSGKHPPLPRDRIATPPSSQFFATARSAAKSDAEHAAINAIEAAAELPFDEGIARERDIALQVVNSPAAVARRHAFFAERMASQIPGLDPAALPARLSHVGVVGAGQMGSGIATALLSAGSSVTLVETLDTARGAAGTRIRSNWANQVKRGQLSAEQVEERMARLTIAPALDALIHHELVIEAVWESLALKKEIFAKLDTILPQQAVLATNTSTLDVDQIAEATVRPESVIGLHFFNPAHVMRLLEVVRGAATSPRCLATALALAKHLRKVPVVVGICDGFVGNRLFIARDHQANQMLIEGATPAQIDGALERFGFPMGTFTLYDMAGAIELGWRLRQQSGKKEPVGDALYAAGRLGQRSGRGYYRYEAGHRSPIPDPEVDVLLANLREAAGIARREIREEEIIDRMILPMINESARIIDEGVVTRASDIDVVWNTGYGWPIDKGGPAFYGDVLGLDYVMRRLEALRKDHGEYFAPSPALIRLVEQGRSLAGAARG